MSVERDEEDHPPPSSRQRAFIDLWNLRWPFGDAVDYCVFRCDLTSKGRVEMIAALTDLIKHDEDRVTIIDLGPAEGMAEDRVFWGSTELKRAIHG